MMFMRMRLIFALLIGGAGLMFAGYVEYEQAKTVKAEPTRIACAVFERRGPEEDNHHVELSAFAVSEDMWHASLSPAGSSSFYSEAWIPVYPRNRGSEPPGKDYRVILKFNSIGGAEELDRLTSQTSLTGIAYDGGVPYDAQELLEECYPGIDCSECYVISVGQAVPSLKRAICFFAGGLVCWAIFGGYVYWAFKNPADTKYGGNAKVDTSAPDFMEKRLSTEIDPEKFYQEEIRKNVPSSADNFEADPEPQISADQEDEAYRKEFAERYGIGGGLMDGGNEEDDASNPELLNY